MKKPELHVDAFEPALPRMLGACNRALTAAVFAVPVPGLPERSQDLVLDREVSALPHGSESRATPAKGQSRPRA